MKSSNGGKVTMGLWKMCDSGLVNGASAKVCKDMPNKEDPNKKHFKAIALDVSRGFAILAALLILIGMWLVWVGHRNACMLLLGGGLASLVAMAVWAAEMLKPYNNWKQMGGGKAMAPGYSFYLNLAGGVLAMIAGLSCLRKPKGANMAKPIASGGG